MSHKIHKHLEQHGILDDCQHGFRTGRGCDTPLLSTTTEIVSNLDRGIDSDAITLNFSKAFDIVSHNKLLQKLKSIGINGYIFNWIQAWLTEHSFVVFVKKSKTQSYAASSAFGPQLFFIYINDFPSHVKTSQIRLSADDTLLFKTIT